ncbi:glycosyltransferase family 2 protein [Candidatus Nomurabacteria bacterium]|nr:glycosyltransferase family 2 protein [Candidatus Nomurabacteria bacterium]
MTKNNICIIIPAFNEATTITGVIDDVRSALKKEKHAFEIVIVNDGSSDDTSKLAEASDANVINHILNTGAGGATATGLSYAERNNFDIAVTMDADGQHSPKDVVKGIEELKKNDADLLIGSRLVNTDGMSKVKILGNKGLSIITYLVFNVKVTDSQSGLRIFSKRALTRLKWRTSGYEFASEMLWRANQLGLKIDEFPIKAIYTEYSMSKGQNNWNAINIIRNLITRRIVELLSE